MKFLTPFIPYLFIVFCCTACLNHKRPVSTALPIAVKTFELAGILQGFENPKTSERMFEWCLSELPKYETWETPDYWANIFTNPAIPDYRREHALEAMFTRHVPPGTGVAMFSRIDKIRTWIATTNLMAATMESIPVERKAGESVFVFSLNLARPNLRWIFLRLSREVSTQALFLMVTGKMRDIEGVKILEIRAL